MDASTPPSQPGQKQLPIDAGTIRMLVQIMDYMDKRQEAMQDQIEETHARLNNLQTAFQTLLGQLEKKIDMIEAAALEQAKSKNAKS